jgi:uncharacterized protein with beta-barrel porin domain
LTGGAVDARFLAGTYLSREYQILYANSVIGTFNSLTTTDLPTGFTATLEHRPGGVFLELEGELANAPSANQRAVANAINQYFFNGGALPPGFVTLYGLTGSAFNNALSQLSGETATGPTQAAFGAMNIFINTLLDPFNDGRGSFPAFASTGDALGFAAAPGQDARVSREARAAYAAVTPRDGRTGSPWSIWATGYGGSSSVSGNAATGSQDTSSQIFGTLVGADYRASPDTLLGFGLGGAHLSYGLTNAGNGKGDVFQAGVFGRKKFGNAYVAGALGYGWQDLQTDRTVTIVGTDKLRATFRAHAFTGRAEAGYRVASLPVGATPYGALEATSFYVPSYGENAIAGSNQFALSYTSQTTTNLRSELGVRLDKTFAVGDILATWRGRLAWAHDSNTQRAANAAFQSLPGTAFTVLGAEPAADSTLVSTGLEVHWPNGFSFAAGFEGTFSGTTESYGGKGTLRYAW